jgi:hypothetical protein
MRSRSGPQQLRNRVVHTLVEAFRADAATLRDWGAIAQADAVERCASRLEAMLAERALEALTLAQAVSESGYSYSSLQKKLLKGELENVGTKGKPLVRRADLPRKVRGESVSAGNDAVFERLLY